MALERYRTLSKEIQEQAPGFEKGLQIVDGLVASLQRRGLLPKAVDFLKVKRETAPKVDLRKQTYDLLTRVIEPSDEEQEALRVKRGLVFLPMTSQSYAQVVAEDPNHFWDKELEYANAIPELRDYTPPIAVEVGLNVAELALPDSFDKPRIVALQMIEEYSQKLEADFPGFKAIMLPVTGYARADRAYAERNADQVLFKKYFAWGLDNISGVLAASAGRLGPDLRFGVDDWDAAHGDSRVGAVPAIVKIGNQ